jgi:hypothetical protein
MDSTQVASFDLARSKMIWSKAGSALQCVRLKTVLGDSQPNQLRAATGAARIQT